MLGGVLAARGRAPLWAILAASVAGPLTGDLVGYLLGRRYGKMIVRRRLGSRWGRARRLLSKERGFAIFLGRFLPFARTVIPVTAGAIAMPARRFLPWDFFGAAVWGVGSTLIGYLAGREYERVVRWTGHVSLGLLALALIAGALLLARSKRRREAASRRRSK